MLIAFFTRVVTCACAMSVPFNNGKVEAGDSVQCVVMSFVTSSKPFVHSLYHFLEFEPPVFKKTIYRETKKIQITKELFSKSQRQSILHEDYDISVFFIVK